MDTSTIFDFDRLVLGALFIIAMLSWLLYQGLDEDEGPSSAITHTPDYWVERLSARTMDARGRVQRVMHAELMQHFPDDGSVDLTKPKIDFLEPSAPTWHVQSETGQVSADGELISLNGMVTVDREATPENLAAHLITRDMRVRPKDKYAETDQPVQMHSGNSHIQSRGLQMWLNRPVHVKLLAEVRAHYEVTR